MGARAKKWPPERLAGMGAFFARIGYKPTGGMERGNRLLRSGRKPSRSPDVAQGGRRVAEIAGGPVAGHVSRRHDGPSPGGPRSARTVRHVVGGRQEPLVRTESGQSRLVLAPRAAASSRSPTTSAPDNPPAIPSCWPSWSRTHRVALRFEAPLSAHFEFANLPAFLDRPGARTRRPRRTSPTIRCGGWRPRC